jgi:hypothetical protein
MNRKPIIAALLLSACSLQLQAQTYSGRIGAGSTLLPEKAGGTVVVALALSDGLVLAADSRLTLTFAGTTKPEYKIASDSASKLFGVGNVGIAFYGEAFILERNISSFVSEFDASLKESKPSGIDETAKLFAAFFSKYYDQHNKATKQSPNIGFILAGYTNDGYGKLIELTYPEKRDPQELPNSTRKNQGAIWRGQIDVITRLIKGFDPAIGSLATFAGLEQPKQQAFVQELTGLQYHIPFAYLMLQDGIDLALMLVQTTVDIQRFSFGMLSSVGAIPGVGGAVDVIAITPTGLTWIRRKSLSAR